VRQADLDGDGRDELCGSNIIGADGKQRHDFDLPTVRPGFNWRDVDSLVIGDVIPGGSLEVAIAEQSGNDEALVFGLNGLIYGVANAGDPCCALCDECREPDPDKVALGNFTGDDALEFFARSACGRAPWVIDSQGKIIAAWTVDSKKPAGWTQAGIEEVVAIDWYGDTYQSLLAKERHMAGAVAVIDALTGQFRMTIAASAARAYAADVAGDYREEIVILDMDGRIKIYWNDAPRIVPRPGYWRLSQYRRQKQNWNYYSP
jgi:hypothetical protein